jgi:formylglycine-generating enzyme required for sulfatase activity
VTGVAPPDAGMRVVELAAEQGDPLRPAHEVNPKIPARVSAALHRALAMSLSKRPATAAEMRRELREAVAEPPPVVRPVVIAPLPFVDPEPISVEPPKSVEPKSEPPPKRETAQPKSASPTANPPAQINVDQTKKPNVRPAIVFVMIIILAAFLMAIGSAFYRDAPSENPLKTSPYELAESSSKTKKSLPKSFKNSLGMEFVLVPAGKFKMGSSEAEVDAAYADAKRYFESVPRKIFEAEQPRHEVTIASPFYLGKYEVTQGEWIAVMGENPSKLKGDNRLPVENVSWDDCQNFIAKLNARDDGYVYRLPSEAEWEYACRAGTTTPFSFGETLTTAQANYDGNYPYGYGPPGEYRNKTTRAGSFPANAWGLHDMHGNVWEWCQDRYHENYDGAPTDGRAREQDSDNLRVVRGGSWFGYAFRCRAANRDRFAPGSRDDDVGVRLAVRLATN